MARRAKRIGPYKRLAPSQFVYPPGRGLGGRRGMYPINTVARARNALARAAQPQTAGSYAVVERAVNRRYPQIATRHHTPRRRRRR
jgi:hypothetical protein